MGLDGISVNQLRITHENNPIEQSMNVKFNSQDEVKTIDGLDEGQKVDPDKQNKQGKENRENIDFDFDDNNEDDKSTEVQEEIKYDLSKTDKYELKLDEETDEIIIIDKANGNVVQRINSNNLYKFVGFLSNSQGAMINRKL